MQVYKKNDKVNRYIFSLHFPPFYAYSSAEFSLHQVVVVISCDFTFTSVIILPIFKLSYLFFLA